MFGPKLRSRLFLVLLGSLLAILPELLSAQGTGSSPCWGCSPSGYMCRGATSGRDGCREELRPGPYGGYRCVLYGLSCYGSADPNAPKETGGCEFPPCEPEYQYP